MVKNRTKLGFSALVALGALGTWGVGSFATFDAETANPGNLFSTGTLVLSNTKQGGTTCLSTGGGATDVNANAACSQLFNLTVKKPGDSGSANLTIENEGTIAASALKVFSAACADGDAPGESYHGTGSMCGKVQLTIQQYSDSGFTTPSACVYGGATGNVCNFSDTAKTLGVFQASYPIAASGLGLGSLASGASAYFTVAVQLPSSADNTFQGRQATIDFTWHADQ